MCVVGATDIRYMLFKKKVTYLVYNSSISGWNRDLYVKYSLHIVVMHQMRVSHLLHHMGVWNVGLPLWGAAGGISDPP